MYCYEGAGGPNPCDTSYAFFASAFAGDARAAHVLWLVLGTCFLALAVNLCSFGLIGRTSPITFQVVGHAKTCLVLIGGYVLFPPAAQDAQQLYNNVLGVTVAMVGVVLYGHLKHAAGQDRADCLDHCCPTCCLHILDPARADTLASEETQGLKAVGSG
jgi:hypothetical protein